MTANELNIKCMTGILPWVIIVVIYAIKAICTIAIVKYKNVKTIQRRRKAYWTKNGPIWEARLSLDQVVSMQYEMQTRQDDRLLAIKNRIIHDVEGTTTGACNTCSDRPKLVARTLSSRLKRKGVHKIKFDTDSIKIAVNTGASRTILSQATDFEGGITPTN